MSTENMMNDQSKHSDLKEAFVAGFKAGGIALGLGLAFPLALWLTDLKQWSFLPFFCSLPLIPAAGILAAILLRTRKELPSRHFVGATAIAGALAGLSAGVGFIYLPAMMGGFDAETYSPAAIVTASICVYAAPAIMLGAGIGALTGLIARIPLQRRWGSPSKDRKPTAVESELISGKDS
jgi:MFS family permease